jgi:hypothetical protein
MLKEEDLFNIISVASLMRKSAFIKKAYSIAELLNTSAKSVKYEKGCNASLTKATPKIGRWIFKVECNEKWSKGPYNVRFRLLKGQTSPDMIGRDIEVSCNCNAWKYNGADYNAMKKDYSERQYSDGSTPNVRDKKRKYLICKHVAACIPIFSNYVVLTDYKKKQKKFL